MKRKSDKKIVVIGGGTGVFTALSGLRRYFSDLTAIVTMADDGGSTGVLREEFGILPPGDVRRALIALGSADNAMLAKLFNYRFAEGKGLSGHSFGNLMLAALERVTGSFPRAIAEAGKMLGVEGRVLPVTLTKTRLHAELENGSIVDGEANIDVPAHDGRLRISRVWLKPRARVAPEAREAIIDADAVLIGPGDLYTSIVPNLLVSGMPEALRKSKAKKIYVVNLMTKFGETNGFVASDFTRVLEMYLGHGVLDVVVANSNVPARTRLAPYVREGAELVRINGGHVPKGARLVRADLLRARGFLRHDSEKLARVVKKITGE